MKQPIILSEKTLPDCPKISYFVFAYNQEKHIEEACLSAFSQSYTPLEIILSDDCSTDSTFEIMSRLSKEYAGPHTIVVNRNKQNLGLTEHVNKAFSVASGEIIVAAAGDDVSFPERVTVLAEVFAADPDVLLVHSDVLTIDVNGVRLGSQKPPFCGNLLGPEDATRVGIYIGASGAWRKKLYDLYGPIKHDAFEDGVLGFRAALLARIRYVEKPLVMYRKINGLSSFRLTRNFTGSYRTERARRKAVSNLLAQRLCDLEQIGLHAPSDLKAQFKLLIKREHALAEASWLLCNSIVSFLATCRQRSLITNLRAIKLEINWVRRYIRNLLKVRN